MNTRLWRGARRRGQALLETSLVVIFLCFLLLGVIGFGTLIAASANIETAARDGARAASAGLGNDAIREAVLKTLSPTGQTNDVRGEVAIAINPATEGTRTFRTPVTVEVWWQYNVPVPVFGIITRDRVLYARKTMLVTAGI